MKRNYTELNPYSPPANGAEGDLTRVRKWFTDITGIATLVWIVTLFTAAWIVDGDFESLETIAHGAIHYVLVLMQLFVALSHLIIVPVWFFGWLLWIARRLIAAASFAYKIACLTFGELLNNNRFRLKG